MPRNKQLCIIVIHNYTGSVSQVEIRHQHRQSHTESTESCYMQSCVCGFIIKYFLTVSSCPVLAVCYLYPIIAFSQTAAVSCTSNQCRLCHCMLYLGWCHYMLYLECVFSHVTDMIISVNMCGVGRRHWQFVHSECLA